MKPQTRSYYDWQEVRDWLEKDCGFTRDELYAFSSYLRDNYFFDSNNELIGINVQQCIEDAELEFSDIPMDDDVKTIFLSLKANLGNEFNLHYWW